VLALLRPLHLQPLQPGSGYAPTIASKESTAGCVISRRSGTNGDGDGRLSVSSCWPSIAGIVSMGNIEPTQGYLQNPTQTATFTGGQPQGTKTREGAGKAETPSG
jgi:hypothetical protein